jgi:hypothetical protein
VVKWTKSALTRSFVFGSVLRKAIVLFVGFTSLLTFYLASFHFSPKSSHFRGTRWACFSTTLGAACHELGHTFDLGHQPEGIMARGFDDIFTVFTSARPASLLYPADNSQSIIPITQNPTLTKKNSELQVSFSSSRLNFGLEFFQFIPKMENQIF